MKLDRFLVAAVTIVFVSCSTETRRPANNATLPTGSEEPTSTAAPEADASLWVAVEDARELVLVDAYTRRVERRIRVPGRPHNITVTSDGTVVAALQRAGTIALMRKGSVTTVELGGSPHDVKPTRDGMVVTNEGASRLDLVSPSGERLGRIPLSANPHDVAVLGDRAWVSLDDSDRIAVVDLEEREVVREISTGKRPHDLLLTSDDRAWVTDWSGTVHVFDASGEIVETLALGREAHHLTLTPDGREIWITDHATRRTYVVDTRTLDVLDTLEIPGAPHHVAVTPDGRWAGVADHDRGTLVLFDVDTRRHVATIPVGPGPHGVWASP